MVVDWDVMVVDWDVMVVDWDVPENCTDWDIMLLIYDNLKEVSNMSKNTVDFPTGLHPIHEKLTPSSPYTLKPSSRALLYYLGRYSAHHDKEHWHYTYFNALPTDGRTYVGMAKYIGYSKNTVTAAFKELTEKGYVEKMGDHYRLYNDKTIWRAIPWIKIDAAFKYMQLHNGETILLETYALLVYAKKLGRELNASQILQFFGRDNSVINRGKIVAALDHLNSNGYCKIVARKESYKDGWASYYVYKIVDELPNVEPTYIERLTPGPALKEEEIVEYMAQMGIEEQSED